MADLSRYNIKASGYVLILKGTTRHPVGQIGNFFQPEIAIEIHSNWNYMYW